MPCQKGYILSVENDRIFLQTKNKEICLNFFISSFNKNGITINFFIMTMNKKRKKVQDEKTFSRMKNRFDSGNLILILAIHLFLYAKLMLPTALFLCSVLDQTIRRHKWRQKYFSEMKSSKFSSFFRSISRSTFFLILFFI